MKNKTENIKKLRRELMKAAKAQDRYDLNTINLIAPASPTPLRYFYNLPLKHNAIAEGLLNNRPYAGVDGFNKIEKITSEIACFLFNAEHANVQPHSVSQANQAVYQALLKNGNRALAMRFDAGGHLTHGMKKNFSGRFFNFDFYGINKEGFLDYEEMEKRASRFKPKLIVCGASAYPRVIDFKRISTIAKKIGAYVMADVSHPAGLIAAKRFPNPFPHCDVVTLTLDKTMLGPHGGIILCKKEIKEKIDRAVHPGVQSSVPLRRLYQMALCLIDANSPRFANYIKRVIENAKILEQKFNTYSGLLVTGGTDTNLMILHTLKVFGLTGKDSEEFLEKIGVLTNRQVVPGESLKPYVASGIRLGTSWITARGYSKKETALIGDLILKNLASPNNATLQKETRRIFKDLLKVKRVHDVWAAKIKK